MLGRDQTPRWSDLYARPRTHSSVTHGWSHAVGQRWPQLLAGPVADAHVQALPGHAHIRGLCVPFTPLPPRPRACTLCSCTTAMLPAGRHGHAESAVQCPWPAPGHRVLLVAESPSCGSLTLAALLLAGTRAQLLTRSLRPLWYRCPRRVRVRRSLCSNVLTRHSRGLCVTHQVPAF